MCQGADNRHGASLTAVAAQRSAPQSPPQSRHSTVSHGISCIPAKHSEPPSPPQSRRSTVSGRAATNARILAARAKAAAILAGDGDEPLDEYPE